MSQRFPSSPPGPRTMRGGKAFLPFLHPFSLRFFPFLSLPAKILPPPPYSCFYFFPFLMLFYLSRGAAAGWGGGGGVDKQRCECISTFTPSSASTKVLPEAGHRAQLTEIAFFKPKVRPGGAVTHGASSCLSFPQHPPTSPPITSPRSPLRLHYKHTQNITTPSPTARGLAGFGATPAPFCRAGGAGGYLTLTLSFPPPSPPPPPASPPSHPPPAPYTHTVFKVPWGMFFFPPLPLSLSGAAEGSSSLWSNVLLSCARCPVPPTARPAPLRAIASPIFPFSPSPLHLSPSHPPPPLGGTHLFLYSHVLRVF